MAIAFDDGALDLRRLAVAPPVVGHEPREPGGQLGGRTLGRVVLPPVGAAARVKARLDHDEAALAANVEPRPELRARVVADCAVGLEEVVPTPATRLGRERLGELAVLALELGERLVAAV